MGSAPSNGSPPSTAPPSRKAIGDLPSCDQTSRCVPVAIGWAPPRRRRRPGRRGLERAEEDAGRVLADAWVIGLPSGQRGDGGFGVHPYRKSTGAHWQLVSLVELAIPARESRAVAAAGHVLAWLNVRGDRVPQVGGLARGHASIEGNALAACCRLGLAADRRVRQLATRLIA
jgi:hypothetical protein